MTDGVAFTFTPKGWVNSEHQNTAMFSERSVNAG